MPAPASCMRTGSSSPEPSLSFRVRSCLSPAHCPRAPGASYRVSVPFATEACEVHSTPGFPHPTTFRPQRFSRSRRFAPPHAVVGLFHPTATSGIRSSGVFLATKPARLIAESVPSCRCRASPHGGLPHRCQLHSPRLQGVHPGSDPLRPGGGLGLPATRSPPGLSTPAGFSPAALETPSRPLRS